MTYLALFAPLTHKWTKLPTAPPFKVAAYPSLVPCDINNDGNMDIIAFEQTGYDTTEEAFTGGYSHEGIFLGKGNGTFQEAEIQFITHDSQFTIEDAKGACNAEVIDVDNDGRLDIILAGHQGETSCNVILHNQTPDSSSTLCFSIEPYDTEFLLREAIIKPADFNNDGFQDFAISALVDGREGQIRFTDVFLNDPEQHGKFIRLGLGEKGADLKRKANGALQVADFNNDGWLDILLAGQGETSSGEAVPRQRIYLNQKTPVPSFRAYSSDFQNDTYTLASSASSVIDWNGDGFYDVLLGGTKGNVYCGMLYLGDGMGYLKRNVSIPGATGACIVFPDYNGDGRKDFLLCGLSKDKNYLTTEQQGRNTILCCNLFPTPSRPDAPLAPVVTKQGGEVVLSWQPAATAQPGFTYEVFLKDEAGNLLNSVPAFVGGTNDGIRKANLLGRVGTRTEWPFLPAKPGTYSWGVQTVDAAYNGSTFTEGPTFTVTEEEIITSIDKGQLTIDKYDYKQSPTLFNLLGQRQSKRNKGINIIKTNSKTLKTLQK